MVGWEGGRGLERERGEVGCKEVMSWGLGGFLEPTQVVERRMRVLCSMGWFGCGL